MDYYIQNDDTLSTYNLEKKHGKLLIKLMNYNISNVIENTFSNINMWS